MKLKDTLAASCAVALIGAMASTAFADDMSKDVVISELEKNTPPFSKLTCRRSLPTLTETETEKLAEANAAVQAQLQEWRASCQERVDTWTALTEAQKEEVYALQDALAEDQGKIIDKYVELGLMDVDTAATMKDSLDRTSRWMRGGRWKPMVGGQGRRTQYAMAATE